VKTTQAAAIQGNPLAPTRLAALATFCASGAILIPYALYLPGGLVWGASLVLSLRDSDPRFRLRMGVLLGCIAILAFAPIHTDTSDAHFVALSACFLAVILLPYLVLRVSDPGVVRYRLFPRRFRWLDLAYVGISIPLSWLAFEIYFGWANPEVPNNWFLPPVRDMEAIWRLFIGINGVGIWDELFFVNTVFAVLRSLFPYRVANLGQSIIYTAVLYDMAFTGIGPILVFVFALTQGAMFESTENLLYVIVVHLIVDAFLFSGIVAHHYPGFAPLPF